MKKFQLVLSGALVLAFQSCINSDYYDAPDLSNECTTLTTTKTVADIKATATTSAQEYTADDIIEAYAVSSDEGGNFYKSISFVTADNSQAFSMPVDSYNLYTKFEPGRKVYIKMKGLYYANDTQTSSFDIGSLYNGNEVGRLSGVQYEQSIIRGCDKKNEDDLVLPMTITQAKNNANINKLIEIDAVQFDDAFVGKTYYDATNVLGGATNNLIKDADGNSLIVRVSEYVNFAANVIPSKNGKIRGVMTKYNNDFQFMIRTINDVKLENPRVVPLFEETFTSNFGGWNKISVTGAQVWTLDTQFGNPGSCAKMSGFANSTNNANEDWLISPSINLASLTSNAKMNFQTASRFAGNLLEIYVSTNYTSGAPTTATWTQITGATLDLNTAAYVWTNSGDINLTPYIGNSNFRVAFRYTSTTSASRTWEVDNVKITGQ